MNLSINALSITLLNRSPFIINPRLSKPLTYCIKNIISTRSFSPFLTRNLFLNSLTVSKSTFSKYLAPALNEQIYLGETYVNRTFYLENDVIRFHKCKFLNFSTDGSVIKLGHKLVSGTSFYLTESEFHNCFVSNTGCVDIYADRIIIRDSCFHKIHSNLLTSVLKLYSNPQKDSYITDNSFAECSSDSVSYGPITYYSKGVFTIKRQNMTFCRANSPAFIMFINSECTVEVCSFSHCDAATCILSMSPNKHQKFTDGYFNNVSLSFEIVDLSTFGLYESKISIENYLFKMKPGYIRKLDTSSKCAITLVDCISEYPIAEYFPVNALLIEYGTVERTQCSLVSWSFPVAKGCDLYTMSAEPTPMNKYANVNIYITVIICSTVIIILLMIVFYFVKTQKKPEQESESLVSSFSSF